MTTSSQCVWFARLLVFGFVCAAFCIAGCDSSGHAVRDTRKNLDAFKSAPSDFALEKLDKSFTVLDGKVRSLEADGDVAQADLFRRQSLILRQEYHAVRNAYLKWKADQEEGGAIGGSNK